MGGEMERDGRLSRGAGAGAGDGGLLTSSCEGRDALTRVFTGEAMTLGGEAGLEASFPGVDSKVDADLVRTNRDREVFFFTLIDFFS